MEGNNKTTITTNISNNQNEAETNNRIYPQLPKSEETQPKTKPNNDSNSNTKTNDDQKSNTKPNNDYKSKPRTDTVNQTRAIELNGSDKKKSGDKKRNAKESQVESHEMVNKCAIRPKDNDDGYFGSIACCHSIQKKFGFKCFIFMLVFGLDAADLISDWLLYRDVAATEDGLVYGHPHDALRYSLLTFSVIGSLTFTFEITNLWWEIFRNNPWMDTDLLSAITVWIEDVPQITINIFIVICRDEAISYFQLVKASIIIIGSIIRVVVSMVRYCSKRARLDLECASENAESRRHVVYRVFIMVGLFLTLGGAISIFMFTQSERNPDGSINFKIPHSVLEGEYDDEKYFQNVSLYFSHKSLDYDNTFLTSADVNMIRLATIYDIRNEKVDGTVKIQYDQSDKFYLQLNDGTAPVVECFQINRSAKTITISTSCSAAYVTAPTAQLDFSFHYIKAKIPGLIYGDIKYNVKVNSTCADPSFSIGEDLQNRVDDHSMAFLRYYRTNAAISDGHHLIHTTSSAGRFYNSGDLTDITSVWKTGYGYCSSSGSVAPHLDTSIAVTCT